MLVCTTPTGHTPWPACVLKPVRTSLTDHMSGCKISASGGDLRINRSRHKAAFFRTMDRTAPFVCKSAYLCHMEQHLPLSRHVIGTKPIVHIFGVATVQPKCCRCRPTRRFMTSTDRRDAISCPPTWPHTRQVSAWHEQKTQNCVAGQAYARPQNASLAEQQVPGFTEALCLPFPTNPRARHWKASLRDIKSFRMELMINLKNSSFCGAKHSSVNAARSVNPGL